MMWIAIKPVMFGAVVAFNNFAACLALGTLGQLRHRFILATLSGVLGFVFPWIGIWAGGTISHRLKGFGTWMDLIVIGGFGFWMTLQSVRSKPEKGKEGEKEISWKGIVLLAVVLNLDNALIDFGIGSKGGEPFILATASGIFSFIFSWLGMWIGHYVEAYWEQRAIFVAGMLLVLMSVMLFFGWL